MDCLVDLTCRIAELPQRTELLAQAGVFPEEASAAAADPTSHQDAMAEEVGTADLHCSLRGSLLPAFQAKEEETATRRHALRAALRTAWSSEALRRGMELAKGGDLSEALACHDQALELDPISAKALLARGAAQANNEEWQQASEDLQAVLKLAPNSNAAKYLSAVQDKARTSCLRLLSLGASSRHLTATQQQEASKAGKDGTAGGAAQQQRERGRASYSSPSRSRSSSRQRRRQQRILSSNISGDSRRRGTMQGDVVTQPAAAEPAANGISDRPDMDVVRRATGKLKDRKKDRVGKRDGQHRKQKKHKRHKR